MARLTLVKTAAPGNFPAIQPTANSLDVAMVVTVLVNKAQFSASGKDLVFAHNTGAGAGTVTINSVADPKNNRTGDITAYSIGAGEYAVFGPFSREGWVQTDGNVYLEASTTDVKFGVVSLPQ